MDGGLTVSGDDGRSSDAELAADVVVCDVVAVVVNDSISSCV
jgi:hypothetical protein